jgi:hypothetical protein
MGMQNLYSNGDQTGSKPIIVSENNKKSGVKLPSFAVMG